jgi:cysteine desulfurase/selenocysteine lyase
MTSSDTFDVEKLRLDFPALDQQVHGHKLVYLDNAATTQKPRAVLDAITRYYENDNANVHRGVHTLSQRATDAYEMARDHTSRFVGARKVEEIVFTRGTTEAINLVAWSFVAPRLSPGDEVMISHLEHHSNIVPWQLVCADRGARLVVAPVDDHGDIELDFIAQHLGDKTRFLAMSHISNALGTVNPVREITALAHARGVPVLIDGAQAAPHLPIDVQQIGCDFYAFSGHKVFGPTGIGALYVKNERYAEMRPYQGGGDMIKSVSFAGSVWNDPPHKFEAGTPDIAGAIGLCAALDYMEEVGRWRVASYELELFQYAADRLAELPFVRRIGQAKDQAGAISFAVEGVHPHDVGTVLDHRGIAVRAGHHCAQPVMERFGVPATARASFAFYNTAAEVDRLIFGLHEVAEMFRR